jgi:hypothetical protein
LTETPNSHFGRNRSSHRNALTGEDGEIKQVNARFRKLFGIADHALPDQQDIARRPPMT